ncbi:phosphogluconate dehydrogenase (NAD(+)-dependent, decarboxylating) [Paenibacillus turpanensis]|uniref:phosphogluconate dehydrogenase (NAD(+)-dependent, decarboxylating) n=1 Tax=Paenibacillus turpanensis TaxID=2689078 RepID=UPI0014083E8B|nr:decarboxylating 6-phosphogluconate dehydrogenase [Paenibacillus turpanensis]
MKIGLVGLGKMGLHLALNLRDHGHEVVGMDRDKRLAEALTSRGGQSAETLEQLVDALPRPRTVWVMVPSGAVQSVVSELAELLAEGDRIIDGGNSFYKDSVRLGGECAKKNIHFLDVGTSGGMEGARSGACMMIGGNRAAFEPLEPLFADLCVPDGYLYAGPSGSGHFLKMIHNGIEYGMMQAIGEGFELLVKSDYEFDLPNVAKVWSNGSVIRGWLMELTERALSKDAKLDGIQGVMHSSGEGLWTVETALELQAAVPVMAMSLMMRYRSQESDTFHGKVVSALRAEFGGHSVMKS